MPAVSMAWMPLLGVVACASGPPTFRVEPLAAGAPPPNSEWIAVGSPSMPPPDAQRFARLYADGTADVRELFTSNGPGPWLSLTGRVAVPPFLVKDALTTATAPQTSAPDRTAPCVVAVDSAAAKWQGCAYPVLAARLLASVPRLTIPDVSPLCELRVCQVRILREVPPARHERYGDVRGDRVFDSTGAFWCAAQRDQPAGQIATLSVEHGTIAEPEALHVFQWAVGDVVTAGPASESLSDSALDRVMVRQRTGEWTPLAPRAAARVRDRWERIAARLPESCRSGR